ncbi:MAG: hypothetical protein BalsKO_09010 [Balneolaceae bacterium]
MRNKNATRDFYISRFGFEEIGDYEGYLMVRKENIEIHFFEFNDLNPKENYGQVYIRTKDIEHVYESLIANKIDIHPNGTLSCKPWGQKEFSILDPDSNLLTFGQNI